MKIKKTIRLISISILSLGLILTIKIMIRILFFDYDVKDSEMKFAFVLIITGLIGTVLDFVLKKVIHDFLIKYLSQEKLQQIVDDKVIEIKEQEKGEDDRNNIIEKEEKKYLELDTVIVPVTYTYSQVKSNLEYRCPSNYSFKNGLKYIAFYKKKQIIGYGRLTENCNYQTPKGSEKIFMIEKFIRTEIPHKRKGAFIQSKKYCTSVSLKSAKNTDEILPSGIELASVI